MIGPIPHTIRLFLILFSAVIILQSCGPDRLDDYSDDSFNLVNQHGEEVTFPDDFRGSPVVVGFIYTNCPDICSFITANIKKIHDVESHPDDTRFLLISFDPERDTPATLRNYADAFGMNQEPFHFLTGDTAEIDRLMKRVKVRTSVSDQRQTDSGEEVYFLNHSDKILLIDRESRLVFDYGGSMTPVDYVAEDLSDL